MKRVGVILVVVAMILAGCKKQKETHAQDQQDTPRKKVEDILTAVDPVGKPKPEVVTPDPPKGEAGDENPVIPLAQAVPDKPGFVISPYNGKWIDVNGISAGTVMADPHFPAEEKKYFRVPEPQPIPEHTQDPKEESVEESPVDDSAPSSGEH